MRYLVETFEASEASGNQNIKVLLDFSLGRLADADALDALFEPGWTVMLVDMVLHEVTRNQTPTSDKLAAWATAKRIPVLPTKTCAHFKLADAAGAAARKNKLGELAIQESMNEFALMVRMAWIAEGWRPLSR